MKLYSYWRSTTSYRVRAALNLKGVDYEIISVNLVAGEQRQDDYLDLNPAASVPTLILDDGTLLTQSMAILDYIDSTWPEPSLIPQDKIERAKVLAVSHIVALDIHPINNLRVIEQLKQKFNADPDHCKEWMQLWMREGFKAIEAMLPDGDAFAFGDRPGLADLCIVAQVYNARRWELDLTPYPSIVRIEQFCLELPEIFKAHPVNQTEAKDNK